MIPCRKCGEMIDFIQQPNGKRHPVDTESLGMFTLTPGTVVVTPEGTILRGTEATKDTQVQGYTSHFATCPFAKDFRKK